MSTSTKKKLPEAQNPLILRAHRLMEAFAKSDDERDFYLDRIEGFLVYVDLDKTHAELSALEEEIENFPERYLPIPKLTFFETKKIMEGFVTEKVYDIDTKEKLLDIIQSKEARENFLEFIYDHHHEWEKWQQYYQERSRIRIIEWLRNFNIHFVFEEDLELATNVMEKLKHNLFQKTVPKEIEVARKSLAAKAKTYYSNEALNPRPKRGRPPKQQEKVELEPQVTSDIYTSVPTTVRPFLFTPDISSVADITFSSRFETGLEKDIRRSPPSNDLEDSMNNISIKLAQLRQISSRWMEQEGKEPPALSVIEPVQDELEDLEEEEQELFKKLDERNLKPAKATTSTGKKSVKQVAEKKKPAAEIKSKPQVKRIMPSATVEPAKKAASAEKTLRPARKIKRKEEAPASKTPPKRKK